MRGTRAVEAGAASGGVLDLIRQYSLGDGKHGTAIWLIARLARRLPKDIIKNAPFVSQLGGPKRALRRSIQYKILHVSDLLGGFEQLRR